MPRGFRGLQPCIGARRDGMIRRSVSADVLELAILFMRSILLEMLDSRRPTSSAQQRVPKVSIILAERGLL